MTWLRRYRIRHYVENSLWILPLEDIVARWRRSVPALARGRDRLGIGFRSGHRADRVGDHGVVDVHVYCVRLLRPVGRMQLASAQLTPRIIAIVQKSRHETLADGVCLHVHLHAGGSGPYRDVRSPADGVNCGLQQPGVLGLFLYLMDCVLQVVAAERGPTSVAQVGRHVIESVYPRLLPNRSTHPWGRPTARRGAHRHDRKSPRRRRPRLRHRGAGVLGAACRLCD